MRKIIVSTFLTLDGFMAGLNDEMDWNFASDDYHENQNDLLNKVDAILLGRVTYQLLVQYWPTYSSDDDDLAERINSFPKIVFSKILENAGWGKWNNARLVKDNIAEEIAKLKQQPGKIC